MINAPCVIIADFEADNKKCDEKYGGQTECANLPSKKLTASAIQFTGLVLEMYGDLSYIEEKMPHKNLSKESIKNK